MLFLNAGPIRVNGCHLAKLMHLQEISLILTGFFLILNLEQSSLMIIAFFTPKWLLKQIQKVQIYLL